MSDAGAPAVTRGHENRLREIAHRTTPAPAGTGEWGPVVDERAFSAARSFLAAARQLQALADHPWGISPDPVLDQASPEGAAPGETGQGLVLSHVEATGPCPLAISVSIEPDGGLHCLVLAPERIDERTQEMARLHHSGHDAEAAARFVLSAIERLHAGSQVAK